MHSVLTAYCVKDYVLRITFEDQSAKLVDLQSYLTGEMLEPLKDPYLFARFRVDVELETLVWENGADFSPDFLYDIGKTLV